LQFPHFSLIGNCFMTSLYQPFIFYMYYFSPGKVMIKKLGCQSGCSERVLIPGFLSPSVPGHNDVKMIVVCNLSVTWPATVNQWARCETLSSLCMMVLPQWSSSNYDQTTQSALCNAHMFIFFLTLWPETVVLCHRNLAQNIIINVIVIHQCTITESFMKQNNRGQHYLLLRIYCTEKIYFFKVSLIYTYIFYK